MRRRHLGRPPRLAGWDYSPSAIYFVTFKVLWRRPVLGRVENGRVLLAPAGLIVFETAELLPDQFPGIVMDRLVITPDHPVCRSRGEPPNSLMAHPAIVLGQVIRFWKA